MNQLKTHIASFIFFISITVLFAQENGIEVTGYAGVEGETYTTTTGGIGGDTIVVTSLDELRSFAKNREKNSTPAILIIHGKLEVAPSEVITFKHGANLSILGHEAELVGIGIRIWNYHNVIIQNLKIREVFYPDDALSVEECHHVWINHNELHSKIGPGIGVDTYDGLLDIKKGSRYITVSWNHFHHHMKCMLIGHTDNATQGEIDRDMRITIHHNIFEYTNGRNPSLRWGAAHIFNNYYGNIDDYAIALRQGAHGLIENNIFHNVKTSISTNKFTGEGKACVSGNIYSGSADESSNSITQSDCEFWDDLPYAYQLDATDSLETFLRNNCGTFTPDSTHTAPDTTVVNHVAATFNKSAELKCFPNPVSDTHFTISFKTKNEERMMLSITDLSGKRVMEQCLLATRGNNRVFMEKGKLQAGIYLIKLSGSKSGTAHSRMVIP